MGSLINPNVAYMLTLAAAMLIMLPALSPASTPLRVVMLLFLAAAGYAFVSLEGNAWAFLVGALSLLPFFLAIRQTRPNPPLLFISFLMLAVGSFFLFSDPNGMPAIDYGLAGLVSFICGSILWTSVARLRNVEGINLASDPDSMIGLLGECRTDIEAHSTGSVWVEGELWQARSKSPIPAGSAVRTLRQDGAVLTVKKVEKIPKR